MLAANGIGTPRLLLTSASARFPNGLANSSGLVGRRLMMHPFGTVVGLFDEDLGSTHGLWGQHIHCLEFYETDASRGFRARREVGPAADRRPALDDARLSVGRSERDLGNRLSSGICANVLAVPPCGASSPKICPRNENRVVLDPVLKDADGIPAPKLIYRMSENSHRLLAFHLARAKESLEAAGANEVVIAPLIRETGLAHPRHRARWATDPATSVVDPWGRCHDVPNLFIFDGSIWPTSSGMNPTATIAALALWCAEHLVEQRRTQKVSGVSFDSEERAVLAELADILIPAGEGFPSASDAGVARDGLDRVLAFRPDLADGLKRLIAAARGCPAAEFVAELPAQRSGRIRSAR